MKHEKRKHPALHIFDTVAASIAPNKLSTLDEIRDLALKSGLSWDDRCYAPPSIYDDCGFEPELGGATLTTTVNAWKFGKHIFRFDSVLEDEVAKTRFANKIDLEILKSLPGYTVFVEGNFGVVNQEFPMVGFFAGFFDSNLTDLRSDMNGGFDGSLRLLLLPVFDGVDEHGDKDYAVAGIPITRPTIDETFNHIIGNMTTNSNAWYGETNVLDVLSLKPAASKMVNALLYICSQINDINYENGEVPDTTTPKKTKKGARLMPSKKQSVWDVGIRMGPALRAARRAVNSGGSEPTGRKQRPHFRSAHWHTYHYGKNRRLTKLKWLPPIPVNVDIEDADKLPAVVHKTDTCATN